MATPQVKYSRDLYGLFKRVLDENEVVLLFSSQRQAERYRSRLYAFRKFVMLEKNAKDPGLALFIATVTLKIIDKQLILAVRNPQAQRVWRELNGTGTELPRPSNHGSGGDSTGE